MGRVIGNGRPLGDEGERHGILRVQICTLQRLAGCLLVENSSILAGHHRWRHPLEDDSWLTGWGVRIPGDALDGRGHLGLIDVYYRWDGYPAGELANQSEWIPRPPSIWSDGGSGIKRESGLSGRDAEVLTGCGCLDRLTGCGSERLLESGNSLLLRLSTHIDTEHRGIARHATTTREDQDSVDKRQNNDDSGEDDARTSSPGVVGVALLRC